MSLTPTGFNLYPAPTYKSIAFDYLHDPALVLYNSAGQAYQTGGFRPLQVSDLAANVSVSGLNLTVGAVAVTGISNVNVVTFPQTGAALNVSGNLVANQSSIAINAFPTTGASAPVTGTVAISSFPTTGPALNVSGTVNAAVSVGSVAINAFPATGAAASVTGSVSITNPILAVSGNLSASISSVAVTGTASVTGVITIANTATFAFNLTGITSGQGTVPQGVKGYSFAVISGSACVNSTTLPAGTAIGGGGYPNYTSSAAMVYGCTGGYLVVSWEA